MAIIEFFLAGGVTVIAQGIFTATTGDARPLGFLMRPPAHTNSGRPRNRLVGGVFFIASGLWVLHVPFAASLHSVSIANWFAMHAGLLLVVAFCAVLGAFMLAWPAAFIGWLRSYYPGLQASDRWALMIPRGIGIGSLVIAIQILAGMLYYTPGVGSR